MNYNNILQLICTNTKYITSKGKVETINFNSNYAYAALLIVEEDFYFDFIVETIDKLKKCCYF